MTARRLRMPTSQLPGATDYTGVWPHLVDRTKPGFLMVTPDGRRFANESQNYRDLVIEMIDAFEERGTDTAWLIADHRAVKRWGIGFVRPFPIPRGRYIKNGYLKRGKTHARSLPTSPRSEPPAHADAQAMTWTMSSTCEHSIQTLQILIEI